MVKEKLVFNVKVQKDKKVSFISKQVDMKRTNLVCDISGISIDIDEFKLNANVEILILETFTERNFKGRKVSISRRVLYKELEQTPCTFEVTLEPFVEERNFLVFCTMKDVNKKDFNKKVKVSFY